MKKIRYRCEAGSSNRAEDRFHHIERLGCVTEIRGYRFQSTRSYIGDDGERHFYTTTHERVLVKGENGTARFDGVCWGYGGSGPNALRHLLDKIGFDSDFAAHVAHKSPRLDAVGTDWIIKINGALVSFLTSNAEAAAA